ncbi:hypothetical protein MKW94_001225 [Papaver nudicaule]|uniref:Splicing factor 3B subunit 1 domain-containing protein n=1 Tax=Papaver nudicaule TaxID=74823 RepID=A0AA41SIL1_PAPNU|nr:hypothetical protein [Papaver nudicaule]
MDHEIAKTQEERKKMEASLSTVTYDTEFYDSSTGNRYEGYENSIAVNEEEETVDTNLLSQVPRKLSSYTAPQSLLHDITRSAEEHDGNDGLGSNEPLSRRIIDREDPYKRRRLNRVLSPDRVDAFALGDKTPSVRTYGEIMREEALKRDREETLRQISKKKKKEEEEEGKNRKVEQEVVPAAKRRNRWDVDNAVSKKAKTTTGSDWDMPDSAPGIGRWDATPTPGRVGDATPGIARRNRWDETPTPDVDADATPSAGVTPSGMTWDSTPKVSGLATPTPKRQRSRWEETPANMGSVTPMPGATPGVTPSGGIGMVTPTSGQIRQPMTPEQYNLMRWEKDIDERNRLLTDEELDSMFPQEGYKVLEPPATYVPIRTPARKLTQTPTPLDTEPYQILEENRRQDFDVLKELPGGLPPLKPEDHQIFDDLLKEVDEETLTPYQQKDRKILMLLLKVKNGTPPQRKTALRQLTDKARELGAGPLFERILPLLMQPTLEDQERHLLVKVIDRVLYKLDDLVRPFAHKILVVIEPLLIDEDYYARVEGREIISNLSKAAGLATMIAAMRPDIDNIDEYVRNTTARAFSVVASALGIPALLPFLKAVCQSKKSWQARHTGINIVQQIAILIGCAVLPVSAI